MTHTPEATYAPNALPKYVGREVRVLQHLPRWSIVRTIRQQSVAEHTTMVCILVDRMCAYLNAQDEFLFARNEVTPDAVVRLALYHDLSEVLSGDIANPAKQAMFSAEGAKENYKEWEAARLKERFPWYSEPTNKLARDVIGLCDLLEAELFLLEEFKIGNVEVAGVEKSLNGFLMVKVGNFLADYGVNLYTFVVAAKAEIVLRDDLVVEF